MSDNAPRIITVKVPVDKIGEVIGPKGKMINSIQEDTGAEITIEDDGTIYIGATDGTSAEAARSAINAIANPHMPEIGERFLGTVVKTTTFGAFVSLLPGKDGLLHISQIRKLHGGQRIENVDDVIKVGDKIQVEIRAVENGKLSLVPVEVIEREAAGEDLGGGGRDDSRGDSRGDRPERSRDRGDRDRSRTGDRGRSSDRGSASASGSSGDHFRTRHRERESGNS
jgi:polyribonucleotide nucleotidyltransferase